jgi:hypothetical protein
VKLAETLFDSGACLVVFQGFHCSQRRDVRTAGMDFSLVGLGTGIYSTLLARQQYSAVFPLFPTAASYAATDSYGAAYKGETAIANCCINNDSNVSCLLPLTAPMRVALLTHADLPRRSEKDKIILGETCLPNTMQFVEKRKYASGPLYHFNNSSDPSKSDRLFERFVAAEWSRRRAGDRPVSDRLGGDVLVTTAYYRDYGHNIIIGDNSIIGSDCQLLGSGRVAIGSNTKIGARVTISTQGGPLSRDNQSRARAGSQVAELIQW